VSGRVVATRAAVGCAVVRSAACELGVGACRDSARFRGGSASCAEAQLGAPAHHPYAVCRIPGGSGQAASRV